MKILLYCVLGVLGLGLTLALIALLRTLLTPAKTSDWKPKLDQEREKLYGQKLRDMVRYETVSRAGDPQREKFLGFHRLLAELFPLVHQKLEKTEIDGNLLFYWKGKSSERPVVLMGHQAVGGSDYTGHSDIGNLRMLTGDEMGKGYDYLALGHIHRPQTLNHDLADEYTEHSIYLSGIMRYSGSALHVSCDEQYPHSVSLVDIDRHNGNVELRRLTINELRHFYLLPDIDKDAAQSAEEIYSLIDDFCTAKGSGYIRLRIDSKTALPADFIQTIYDKLEATGNEVRFNPKTIWENGTEEDGEEKKPDFEVAELQQMTNPLEFVRKIIDQYPELNIGELESDFAEIEAEMQKGEEAK